MSETSDNQTPTVSQEFDVAKAIAALPAEGQVALFQDSVQQRKPSALKLILASASIDPEQLATAFLPAVRHGHLDIVSAMLPYVDVNFHDKLNGYTPLMSAAMQPQTECVDLLLASPNIDINATTTPDSHITVAILLEPYRDSEHPALKELSDIADKIFKDPRFDATAHDAHNKALKEIESQKNERWKQVTARDEERRKVVQDLVAPVKSALGL
ncbi:MAG: ankyrin repeat domain-containing protein [Alphaproteobacteria bacterium]|nr:ankyrin repeat domain-containing protein [Alphaproteobacteria bacterium]